MESLIERTALPHISDLAFLVWFDQVIQAKQRMLNDERDRIRQSLLPAFRFVGFVLLCSARRIVLSRKWPTRN